MVVAVLCGHENSPYARSLLQALSAVGVMVVNVVAAAGRSAPKSLKAVWQTHGWAIPLAFMRRVADRLGKAAPWFRGAGMASSANLETDTASQGGKFIVVEEVNGDECCSALRNLGVDLMILAGAPIVRAPVLAIPRIGTLNAHQGALPRFRGMNVIEWAIFQGAPPTITIHFVDPGVDTGDIVTEEAVPVQRGDSLQTVRERASTRQVGLLVRTVKAALAGPLPRRSQRPEDGQQYFSMHPRLREVAEERLQKQILESLGT